MEDLFGQLAWLFNRVGIDPIRVLTLGGVLYTLVEALKQHIPKLTGYWALGLAAALSVFSGFLAFGTESILGLVIGIGGIFAVATGVNRTVRKLTTPAQPAPEKPKE